MLRVCLEQAQEDGDEKPTRAFEEAGKILGYPTVTFLRVADWNTTGLYGEKWDALLKRPGVSVHHTKGTGGSWGIGKNAPFTLSPLRTVFYWTRFTDENGGPTERFQGKAVLMAHEMSTEQRQSTGFYGLKDGCRDLTDVSIPDEISEVEGKLSSRKGTSLWIAGFQEEPGWQERIARSVVASFFGAISDGQLVVTIEPSDQMTERDLIDIKDTTIRQWFEYLAEIEDGTPELDDEDDGIKAARQLWELLQEEPTFKCQANDLGYCQLWIKVSEDQKLPRIVGLMRKTGMLITTRQSGLIRFPGSMRDFIAICRFEGDDGNELLRQMENPRHDQFEPDRIENDPKRRKRGDTALKEMTRWIRDKIKEKAAPNLLMEQTRLSELDRLLPDVDPEEPFADDPDEEGDRERSFEGAPVVELKPHRRAPLPVPPEPEPEPEDDPDPEPDPDPGPKRRRMMIEDVRLLPVGGEVNRYRVSLIPAEDGVAEIALAEAGDSRPVPRADLKAWSMDGNPMSLRNVSLATAERVEFRISADDPIGERAWIVYAVESAAP